MIKEFFRDSIIYGISALIQGGLGFLLLPIYTRALEPSDFGFFDLIITLSYIINTVLTLEISQGAAFFYSTEKDENIKKIHASTAFWFTLFCYAFFTAVSFLFGEKVVLLLEKRVDINPFFEIIIAYFFLFGIFYFIQNQLRWELKSREYAALNLLMSFSTAVVSILLAYILRWGLKGMLFGLLFGNSVSSILGLCWLRNTITLSFSWNSLRKMLFFSLPLMISSIFIWVNLYVDRLIIFSLLSVEEVGLYGVGYRVANIAVLSTVGFRIALTPLVYKYYQNPDTPLQISKIFRFFIAFSLFLFLFLSLFSNEIIRIMASDKFWGSAFLVFYLVPSVLLSSMYIFAPGIFLAKKTFYWLIIYLFGSFLNISLTYFFVKIFGLVGAGIAKLAAHLLIFSAQMIVSQKFYYVPHSWRSIVLSTLTVTALAFFIPRISMPYILHLMLNFLVLLASVYLMTIFNLLRKEEIKYTLKYIGNLAKPT